LALSDAAKVRILDLVPFMSEARATEKWPKPQRPEKSSRVFGSPPLASMKDLHKSWELTRGFYAGSEQLTRVFGFHLIVQKDEKLSQKAESSICVAWRTYGSSFSRYRTSF
jgi:hypothetical protein